jgi:hypothetical protein
MKIAFPKIGSQSLLSYFGYLRIPSPATRHQLVGVDVRSKQRSARFTTSLTQSQWGTYSGTDNVEKGGRTSPKTVFRRADYAWVGRAMM